MLAPLLSYYNSIYDRYTWLSKACCMQLCSKIVSNISEAKLVKSGNLGSFYKYVNRKLNDSNGTAPLRDEHWNLLTANAEKTELLNNYYCGVLTTDNDVIDSSRLPEKVTSDSIIWPL